MRMRMTTTAMPMLVRAPLLNLFASTWYSLAQCAEDVSMMMMMMMRRRMMMLVVVMMMVSLTTVPPTAPSC